MVADKPVTDAGGSGSAGVTRSDIRRVQGEDRLAELARMLAGDDTAVAREHAAELLEAARAEPRPGWRPQAQPAAGNRRPSGTLSPGHPVSAMALSDGAKSVTHWAWRSRRIPRAMAACEP